MSPDDPRRRVLVDEISDLRHIRVWLRTETSKAVVDKVDELARKLAPLKLGDRQRVEIMTRILSLMPSIERTLGFTLAEISFTSYRANRAKEASDTSTWFNQSATFRRASLPYAISSTAPTCWTNCSKAPFTITAYPMLWCYRGEVSMSTLLICGVALIVGLFVFGIVALADVIITDCWIDKPIPTNGTEQQHRWGVPTWKTSSFLVKRCLRIFSLKPFGL